MVPNKASFPHPQPRVSRSTPRAPEKGSQNPPQSSSGDRPGPARGGDSAPPGSAVEGRTPRTASPLRTPLNSRRGLLPRHFLPVPSQGCGCARTRKPRSSPAGAAALVIGAQCRSLVCPTPRSCSPWSDRSVTGQGLGCQDPRAESPTHGSTGCPGPASTLTGARGCPRALPTETYRAGAGPRDRPRPAARRLGPHLVPARPAPQRGARREELLQLRVRVLLAAVAAARRAAPGHLEGGRPRVRLTHRRARSSPSRPPGDSDHRPERACVRVRVRRPVPARQRLPVRMASGVRLALLSLEEEPSGGGARRAPPPG